MELVDKASLQQYGERVLAEQEMGGFNFDLARRNEMIFKTLGSQSSTLPKAWKTGTTIVGILYADGVIL
eukprot:gene34509-44267_t